MTNLTPNIQEQFFRTVSGEINIEDFEQWLYQSKELEQQLRPEDYLELISCSFRQPGAKYGLIKLLMKHFNHGDYETWKLKKLLDSVEQKQGDYPRSIVTFYDLYCKGYDFLDNLAFGYGLTLDCPWNAFGVSEFDELKEQQQKDLADRFYPEITRETQRVRDWLYGDKIILTGEQNELDHFAFIDNRTENEKQPTTYQRAIGTLQRKKWWEFWK